VTGFTRMDMIMDARQQISDWIQIDKNSLNDISLEDVEVSAYALENIASATLHMTEAPSGYETPVDLQKSLGTHLACKSYWVEHTRELVLFVWNTHQAKTIVIPEEGWMLRDDITVH
jgi:hypothetical protein